MRRTAAILLVALLALPLLWAGRTKAQEPASSRRPPFPAKPVSSPVKREGPSFNRQYTELTITELVAEDPNRWTDKMRTYVSVGGFVTHVTRTDDGDIDIRICDNPKVEGMDRVHCFVAKCIPRIPCEMPRIGKPITVLGITRYDARAGTHWWEIHPVEQIEK